MSTKRTSTIITSVAAIILAASAVVGTAAAQASNGNDQNGRKDQSDGRGQTDTALATAFGGVDRNTSWQQTSKLKLNFPTFHTEGIAFSQDHIFLSSVQIIEPTVKFATPQGGFDRTAGKGIGHLFVMDKAGN